MIGEKVHYGMYSSKFTNKNMVSGNAYISIGDPYVDPKGNPFRQGSKPKGKNGEEKIITPFQVKMRPKNEENGNFTKLRYPDKNEYIEDTRYISTQPSDKRKLGFGSHDAKRRDEFSNTIRTEQYRSTIIRERHLTEKGSVQLQDTLQRLLEERAANPLPETTTTAGEFSYSDTCPQYDIGRTRVTAFDPKSSRDTYYKFSNGREKRFGDYKPVSTQVGDGSWEYNYKPPMHGGKSEVKNFFDKSHLEVGRDP